jgi:hypothetical protein
MSIASFYSLSRVCQYLTNSVVRFCVNMSAAVFYSLSTVFQYLTMYRLWGILHYVNCCLIQSVCPLYLCTPQYTVWWFCVCMSTAVCPIFISSKLYTFCCFCVTISTAAFYLLSTVCLYFAMSVYWFCVTMSTAVFYSLFTVCQYLTLYSLLVLCLYVQWLPLLSVHCLSVPHNIPSVRSVSQLPLLSSTVCPLSISTSHCTVCLFFDTLFTAAF